MSALYRAIPQVSSEGAQNKPISPGLSRVVFVARADEIKERMNKLYASEVNVGYFNALKPDGGERVLSLTDKDRGTGSRIETSASDEPDEARGMLSPPHQ